MEPSSISSSPSSPSSPTSTNLTAFDSPLVVVQDLVLAEQRARHELLEDLLAHHQLLGQVQGFQVDCEPESNDDIMFVVDLLEGVPLLVYFIEDRLRLVQEDVSEELSLDVLATQPNVKTPTWNPPFCCR